jgi:beta-phosphoglucomutase-like phosphatase (HAD superfamily)
MTLEALLFDVDGTLADSEETHRLAFNDAFADFGLGWQWDRALYKELLQVGGGKQRIGRYIETRHPDVFIRPGLDGVIADLHKLKTELYGERLGSGAVPLRPGVDRLIRQAHNEGIRLAIATTTSRANVAGLFANTMGSGALGWFEVIGSGEWAAGMKPEPEIYLRVLEEMALSPDLCLALEDSANGLKAALAANVATVVTPATYTGDDDFSGALAVISDLGEPGRPFRVLAGDAYGKTFADTDLLRLWLRLRHGQPIHSF